MDDYDRFAYFYDLHYGQFTGDVPFFLGLARKLGDNPRLLELACGSGRITLPLLEAGYQVTGLDLSAQMLALAQKKLSQTSLETQQRACLVQGDMCRLNESLGEEKFDLIILAFNSFLHLDTPESQLACLTSALEHLTPNGQFALVIYNPEVEPGFPANKRSDSAGSVANPLRNSKVNMLIITTDFPEEQQRILNHVFYERLPDGTIEKTIAPLHHSYFTRSEIEDLLQEAGFKILEAYGDYDHRPLEDDSAKFIFVCGRG